MSLTPKTSQKIIVWCIETALNLLIDAVKAGKRELRYSDVTNVLIKSLEGSNLSRRQISRMTYELKRQNYIDVSQGDSIEFTTKAKIKAIDKFIPFDQADHRRRLVSFDIPETKRRERDGFRRAIKNMGFRQVQKSLWVIDKNIGNLVEIAALDFKVEKYVAYFVVEKSNIENHITSILNKKKDSR